MEMDKSSGAKIVTDLSAAEARKFFLKSESYVELDLPYYFNFQKLLDAVSEKFAGKPLSCYIKKNSKPNELKKVNCKLLANKDGKHTWRQFQIIHPALYVSLVNEITEGKNWKIIVERFKEFKRPKNITCASIPVVPKSKGQTNKDVQIHTWRQEIEQRSIELALDYRYMLQTDISDCYPSIYTHSIHWAIHGKEETKNQLGKKVKKGLLGDTIGDTIDRHLRGMNFGQTNGIPQGSVLMHFIAEMVLGYVDTLLDKELSGKDIGKYRILRYRDDYRIFSNNLFQAERIAKILSHILIIEMGLQLNAAKTEASNDIIESSLKPDKKYWIANERPNERPDKDKQNWLIRLHLFSKKFPNSGTLTKQMVKLLRELELSQKKDTEGTKKAPDIRILISLVTEIGYRNPKVLSESIKVLTFFLSQIENDVEKSDIIEKIKKRFQETIPNSDFLDVWLQRLSLEKELSSKPNSKYQGSLCEKAREEASTIWNSDWLKDEMKKVVEDTHITNYRHIQKFFKVGRENVEDTHITNYRHIRGGYRKPKDAVEDTDIINYERIENKWEDVATEEEIRSSEVKGHY